MSIKGHCSAIAALLMLGGFVILMACGAAALLCFVTGVPYYAWRDPLGEAALWSGVATIVGSVGLSRLGISSHKGGK